MESKSEELPQLQVRFELAWSVEFHERGLEKLKDYYLKQVDFERIEAPPSNASFRSAEGPGLPVGAPGEHLSLCPDVPGAAGEPREVGRKLSRDA